MGTLVDPLTSHPRGLVERASAGDRAFLAMDTGPVPQQFGVVLLLDGAADLDLGRVRALLADRVRAVPRLRQRLVRVPLGCGGPIWVDDPGFDIGHHVRDVDCGTPGGEQALLDAALQQIMTPLHKGGPLWRAVLVTSRPAGDPGSSSADNPGSDPGSSSADNPGSSPVSRSVVGQVGQRAPQAALVFVLHHVLADGVGGLAVLAALVDVDGQEQGAGIPAPSSLPRPRPRAGHLVRDAVGRRLASLAGAPRSWGLLRRSMQAGGGVRPPRVTDCSLLQATGPNRRLLVVRTDLAPLRAAAHRHGGSVNDALLVAVAGALHQVLRMRGEEVDSLVLAVPVSGRGTAADPALGNVVTPALVDVPTTGTVDERIRSVATEMRTRKEAATGPAPIATLGWMFRPLARLGGYRWYMNHQHRMHALVSHVRGPAEPLTFGGLRIASAVPVAVGESGNLTVSFEALSYNGRLTVSALVDPQHVPDLDVLTHALHRQLDVVCSAPSE